jgi:hypothetical protein
MDMLARDAIVIALFSVSLACWLLRNILQPQSSSATSIELA